VTAGTLLSEAARQAGIDILMPCGGQGRCGRCAVIVEQGAVCRRSTQRLSPEDVAAGYALACQTTVEGDVVIVIPPQEKIERRLKEGKRAAKVALPFPYDLHDQPLRKYAVTLEPPSLQDQTDDWSRLQRELVRHYDLGQGSGAQKTGTRVERRRGEKTGTRMNADEADGYIRGQTRMERGRRDAPGRDAPGTRATSGGTGATSGGTGATSGETGATSGGQAPIRVSLPVLRKLGRALREGEWTVTVVVELDGSPGGAPRLIDVLPGEHLESLWAAAIDIGTTSNHVWLVDLISGEVMAQRADYNGQIARGEDVISRIVYASKGDGLQELQGLVMETLNRLLREAAHERGIRTDQIYKVVVAGNSTMTHLFAGIPPESIRLMPFITAANQVPSFAAREIGLQVNPEATVDCLPGVASYVGSDITAGVVSSGMCEVGELTLFVDVGTNGEMALGDCTWLISAACSAGPAFEGAGVVHGMRATAGAIEEVWVNPDTHEATYRTIADDASSTTASNASGTTATKPRGICGSGLISLMAEMFLAGVIDKSGNINLDLAEREETRFSGKNLVSRRVREGKHGAEYVVAWAEETAIGEDIVITAVDIDNLMRAKAAMYAGFSCMARSVGLSLADVKQVLIGGAFGQYINVEKAIQIGMLPDMPVGGYTDEVGGYTDEVGGYTDEVGGYTDEYDSFRFLGNTSVRGAYMALLSQEMRQRVNAVGQMMTYLELSGDNTFFDEFSAALFLPHTDLSRFPSVAALISGH